MRAHKIANRIKCENQGYELFITSFLYLVRLIIYSSADAGTKKKKNYTMLPTFNVGIYINLPWNLILWMCLQFEIKEMLFVGNVVKCPEIKLAKVEVFFKSWLF